MANDFQSIDIKDIGTSDTDFVPTYNVGEVTVHAVYISNQHTADVSVTLVMTDGANTHKANILFNTVIPAYSTIALEKPINIPSSTVITTQRKLRIKASTANKLDALASVLVIT